MYFEDFTLDQSYEIDPITITREQILDFCTKYDPLPLHINEEYAQTARFKGIIASGILSFMVLWADFIRTQDPFGPQLVVGMENHLSWSLPVYPNDQLRGTMRVSQLIPRGRHNGVVEFTALGFNQKDQQVMESRFKVLMRRRPLESPA